MRSIFWKSATVLGLIGTAVTTSIAQAHKPFAAYYRETNNASETISSGKPQKIVEGRYYRDRQDRLRQEDWTVDSDGNKSDFRIIIVDPRKNTRHTLLPNQKLAVLSPLRCARKQTSSAPPPPVSQNPGRLELGKMKIEGLMSEGSRMCNPAGRCTESWWVPELGYVSRIIEFEAGGLVRVKRWYNFKIDEDPDPNLFQIPADYQIRQEAIPGCAEPSKLKTSPSIRTPRT